MLGAVVTDWLPLLLAGIGGLGACLLGLRGRREGDEPRCKKCAYNLTGLTSERCPECGSPILPDGIAYGTLRRRWSLFAGGALLLSLCTWSLGSLAYAHLRMINFHAHYPFAWLLTSARRGEGTAFLELIEREKSGLLSVHEINRLVETALAAAEQDLPCRRLNGWLKLLSRWDEDDVFTLEQRARFYSSLHRLVTPTIKGPLRIPERRVGNKWVRKKGPQRVRSGGRLVIPVAHRCSGPFNIYVTGYELTIAGKVLPVSPPHWSEKLPQRVRDRDWAWNISVSDMDIEPGLHVLEFRGKYILLRPGKWLEASDGIPFATKEETAFTSVEVLSAFDPSKVLLMNNPGLDVQVKEAITLTYASAYHDTGPDRASSVYLFFDLCAPLPVDIGCAVIVRLPDRDIRLGTVMWRKGVGSWRCGVGVDRSHEFDCTPMFDADQVTVLLRADPQAARDAWDVTAIWDGELVLGPVNVRHNR